MQKLDSVIFYSIEKAIKSYRQFAQKELKQAGLDITVDQWLVLNCISEDPEVSQKELSIIVFKDAASVTRIIELLVNMGYLNRASHHSDGRRATLIITAKGKQVLARAVKVVDAYRAKAQKGIKKQDLDIAKRVLIQIIKNCRD